MAFSMHIGNTSFELQLSSGDISHHRSKIAIDYIPSMRGDGESDAILKLRNFSGTMRICRIDAAHKLDLSQENDVKDGCNFTPSTSIMKKKSSSKKSFPRSVTNVDEMSNCDAEDDRTKSLSRNVRYSYMLDQSLHDLCSRDNVSASRLQSLLLSQPSLAREHDNLGRLPLHVISRNESLVCGGRKKDFRIFVKKLFKIYPEAIVAADNKGFIPFSEVITNWVGQKYHESCRILGKDEMLPGKVDLSPIAKWAFEMLSELTEKGLLHSFEMNELVADKIASIQSLLKTVLAITDNNSRSEILKMTIFRKVLVKKEALGLWIVKMLMGSKTDASRVIDYFELLSSPKALSNASQSVGQDFIDHLSNIDGIIPSLNKLSGTEKLRASSTKIVQQLLSSCFKDPILIAITFVDVSFHILLLSSYTVYFWSLMRVVSPSDTEYIFDFDDSIMRAPSFGLIILCTYFLIRDDFTNMLAAPSLIDFIKLYAQLSHPGKLIKVSALILAMAAPIHTLLVKETDLRFLHALTSALLWLRLLFFIKGINIKLSAFIVTMNKVIQDMTLFLIFLIIGCYSFANVMMMTIYTTLPEYCDGISLTDSSFEADFCSLNPNRGAVRAFAILAGNVQVDAYNMNPWTTSIWVIYTVYGVIVLLNILIAIVTDSYQHSYSKRLALANSERIPLLAKHLRLKSVANKLFGTQSKCRWLWKSFCLCFILALLLVWHVILLDVLKQTTDIEEEDGNEVEVSMTAKLRVLFFLFMQFICTLSADIALIYLSLKLLGLRVCYCKTFILKFVKSVVSLILGISDETDVDGNRDYIFTMRDAIDELGRKIDLKLDEVHDRISILSIDRRDDNDEGYPTVYSGSRTSK